MGYKLCAYQRDYGCPCTRVVRTGQEYCDEHEKAVAEIEAMECEIAETIKRAREK